MTKTTLTTIFIIFFIGFTACLSGDGSSDEAVNTGGSLDSTTTEEAEAENIILGTEVGNAGPSLRTLTMTIEEAEGVDDTYNSLTSECTESDSQNELILTDSDGNQTSATTDDGVTYTAEVDPNSLYAVSVHKDGNLCSSLINKPGDELEGMYSVIADDTEDRSLTFSLSKNYLTFTPETSLSKEFLERKVSLDDNNYDGFLNFFQNSNSDNEMDSTTCRMRRIWPFDGGIHFTQEDGIGFINIYMNEKVDEDNLSKVPFKLTHVESGKDLTENIVVVRQKVGEKTGPKVIIVIKDLNEYSDPSKDLDHHKLSFSFADNAITCADGTQSGAGDTITFTTVPKPSFLK